MWLLSWKPQVKQSATESFSRMLTDAIAKGSRSQEAVSASRALLLTVLTSPSQETSLMGCGGGGGTGRGGGRKGVCWLSQPAESSPLVGSERKSRGGKMSVPDRGLKWPWLSSASL